jgi:hypothetical protein
VSEFALLDLPGVALTGTYANAASERRSYDPWADHLSGGVLPLGYARLPDEFTISEILLSLQAPWVTPADFYGRVAFAIDPDGYFSREMDWTLDSARLSMPLDQALAVIEDGWPRQLRPLGVVEVWPGAVSGRDVPFIAVKPSLVGPVTIRRSEGARILVCPEPNGVDISASAFGGFCVFGAPLIPMPLGRFPLDVGVIHAMPLNGSVPAGAPPCYRSVIPNTATGGRIEIHFSAGIHGLSLAHASVGVQASPGSPHMAATPVQLSFSGAAGLNLAPNQHAWGTADVAVDGRPIIVDMNFGGGPYGWAYKNRAAPPIVTYYSGSASYSGATMGPTAGVQHGRIHGFDCVKVLP